MLNFYVIVKKNKEGDGRHVELRVNLGYTDKVISFDRTVISEILGTTIRELSTAEVGKKWEIK